MLVYDDVIAIRAKVSLDSQLVSFEFLRSTGEQIEVQLSGQSIFVLQDQIAQMLAENPEMQHWKKAHAVRH